MRTLQTFKATRQVATKKKEVVQELNTPTITLGIQLPKNTKSSVEESRVSKFIQFTNESERMLGLSEEGNCKLAIQCGYDMIDEKNTEVYVVLYATNQERFKYVGANKQSTSFSTAAYNFQSKRIKSTSLYDIILSVVPQDLKEITGSVMTYELVEDVKFLDNEGMERVGYILKPYKSQKEMNVVNESNVIEQPIVENVDASIN